jgi:hypothetical protein
VLAFGPPVLPTDWRKSVSEKQRGDDSEQPAYPDDNGSDPPHRAAVADEAAVTALEAAGECAGGADSPLDGQQLSRLTRRRLPIGHWLVWLVRHGPRR